MRLSREQAENKRMDKMRGCKIGTMPDLVEVHGSDTIEVGRSVRVRNWRRGSKWYRVTINRVDPDGHFQAD